MSIDDMNKAFAGTVGTPLKWCMLIAAFAGMRAGEVANLTAAEVKRSPRGVWYFDLTSRGVNVGNGESVKSDAGRRVIPVHAVLLEQGLLEYVTKIGKGPLFPTVRPRRDGSRGHHLSQIFARHAQKREIKSSFHRFRGAFIWALDHAGIDPDRKAYVVGHGRSWTSKTYNEPGLAADAVVDVVAAVKYEGLKL